MAGMDDSEIHQRLADAKAALEAGEPNAATIQLGKALGLIKNYPYRTLLPAVPDEEEQEALDHIAAFMDIVVRRWRLHEGSNLMTELCTAVHGCQQFVIQHMLTRIGGPWGCWYGSQEVVQPACVSCGHTLGHLHGTGCRDGVVKDADTYRVEEAPQS